VVSRHEKETISKQLLPSSFLHKISLAPSISCSSLFRLFCRISISYVAFALHVTVFWVSYGFCCGSLLDKKRQKLIWDAGRFWRSNLLVIQVRRFQTPRVWGYAAGYGTRAVPWSCMLVGRGLRSRPPGGGNDILSQPHHTGIIDVSLLPPETSWNILERSWGMLTSLRHSYNNGIMLAIYSLLLIFLDTG
jgi:hypothetical protein